MGHVKPYINLYNPTADPYKTLIWALKGYRGVHRGLYKIYKAFSYGLIDLYAHIEIVVACFVVIFFNFWS